MNIINDNKVEVDINILQRMSFIYNALDNGWQIKKKDDTYIFKKKHNNQKEVFLDDYLDTFINKNCNFTNISN